jgi:putative FmdB family regulatory protein
MTMPIYEYQCEKCHHQLEALQKLNDKPLRECPECGRHTLKRLLSAPMFRLAGSGWYETDFKSDKETKRNLAGKDESPPGDSSKEPAPAESKPEAKTETKAESKPDKPEARSESAGPRKTTVTRPAAKPVSRAKSKPPAKKPQARKAVRKR